MSNERLDDLILQYAENKSTFDDYKKIVDKENAEIKSIMLSANLDAHEVGGYKATCTVSQRESMNEAILLDIAHEHGIKEIVKTKEYIDFDALENAIYNGKISENIILEMDKAKEVKEVVTLRVTRVKKKGIE